jgi:hypothetical protein
LGRFDGQPDGMKRIDPEVNLALEVLAFQGHRF